MPRYDPPARPRVSREELLDAIRSARGNVRRACHYLGIARRGAYYAIKSYDLWAEVDAVRDLERRRLTEPLRAA